MFDSRETFRVLNYKRKHYNRKHFIPRQINFALLTVFFGLVLSFTEGILLQSYYAHFKYTSLQNKL